MSEQETQTRKQRTLATLGSIGIGVLSGSVILIIYLFVVPSAVEFYDTDYIMDYPELIAKADAGYMEVCKDKAFGMDCIIKKEFVEMNIERDSVMFDIVGGNGCQYWISTDGEVHDGLEKKLNNNDSTIRYCGSSGFGYGTNTYSIMETGDYWLISSIDRNSMFYHNYFQLLN